MSSEVACLAVALCEGWDTSLFLARSWQPRDSLRSLDFARDDSRNGTGQLSWLRGQLELLTRDSAQFEKADQRFFDQIVWARCAGSDPDDSGSVRQPKMGNDLAFFV